MTHAPTLSIVVTGTRSATHLSESLDWVTRPSMVDIEVLVVADPHRGRSWVIGEQFAAADARVRVVRFDSSRGPGAAINAGLDAATGRYVAWPHPDGLVPEGIYADLVARLERSGSDFVTGPSELFGDVRGREAAPLGAHDTPASGISLADRPALITDDSTATKVFRRSFLVAQSIRAVENLACDDAMLSIAAYRTSKAFDVVDAPVAWRRRDRASAKQADIPVTTADWLRQASKALADASATTSTAGTHYANALLSRVLSEHPGLDALAGIGHERAASDLVREIVAHIDIDTIAVLPISQRWDLALLASGQGRLLKSIRDGTLTPADAPEDLDIPVPEKLIATLGLNDETLPSALRSRFTIRPRPNSATRPILLDYDGAPEISVVVPVHNIAPFVDELLLSIRAAVDVRLEVIVVDDSSTDETWERIRRHAEADARVRTYRSPGRGGGQARNLGVEVARGEYLAFADGDDLVPATAYASMLAAARRTGAEIVSGPYLKFFTTTTWNARTSYGGVYTHYAAAVDATVHPQMARHRAIWNRLFRRDHWLAHAFPFPGVPRANDIVAYMSALTAATRVTVIPDIAYVYRDRPGSGSMTSRVGTVPYTISYFAEELTCARLIAQVGAPGLEREYWSMVLSVDGWGNLGRYLVDRQRSEAPGDDGIAHVAEEILRLAPPAVISSLTVEQQAVWQLVAAGGLSAATVIVEAMTDARSRPLSDLVAAIDAATALGTLPSHVLSRLAWKYVLRRIVEDPAARSPEQMRGAEALFRRFSHEAGGYLPVLPSAAEGRAWRAIVADGPGGVAAALDHFAPHPEATLRVALRRGTLTGATDPSAIGYRRVVASRQEGGVVERYPLGAVRTAPGANRWEAEINAGCLPRHGRWRLEIEFEDAWGPRRAQLSVRRDRVGVLLRRLARIAPVPNKPGELSVRATLPFRAANALRRAFRGR